MDTLEFYEAEDTFGFQKNIKKVISKMWKINAIFGIFFLGFYFYLFGLKLPHNKMKLIIFCISTIGVLIGSVISLISDRVNSWSATFKQVKDDYYLYKKNQIVSKRIRGVVNQWMAGRYDHGRYISIIDEDNREFFLFKGLSKTEAHEVASTISRIIQIPIKIVE